MGGAGLLQKLVSPGQRTSVAAWAVAAPPSPPSPLASPAQAPQSRRKGPADRRRLASRQRSLTAEVLPTHAAPDCASVAV